MKLMRFSLSLLHTNLSVKIQYWSPFRISLATKKLFFFCIRIKELYIIFNYPFSYLYYLVDWCITEEEFGSLLLWHIYQILESLSTATVEFKCKKARQVLNLEPVWVPQNSEKWYSNPRTRYSNWANDVTGALQYHCINAYHILCL